MSRSVGYVTSGEYDSSFTPAARAGFRATCHAAAKTLLARGVEPIDLAVETETVTIPRSFLGFKRAPEYRHEHRVTLQGWQLHEVRTLMGHSGEEWYQWTVAVALGADGELYRVERHREERNGVPTSDNGRVIVTPLDDTEFPLFDVLDAEKFRREPPNGYWDIFPRRLTKALEALMA